MILNKITDKLKNQNMLPSLPDSSTLPLPSIHNVELYLSFHGNDHCDHCITNSGPHRNETMSPSAAEAVINNIKDYSVLMRISQLMDGGEFTSTHSSLYRKLTSLKKPPAVLSDELIQSYSDVLMNRDSLSSWTSNDVTFNLNFARPSIRISGGEFYTWPHRIDGKDIPQEERLTYQKNLLNYIRSVLPEYDIFILTNGRFAQNRKIAADTLSHWNDSSNTGSGQTHICVSLDRFHQAPKGKTKTDMLNYLWHSCKINRLPSPFIYSIPQKRIMLLGRALKNFGSSLCDSRIREQQLNENLRFDPVDLIETDGCNELRGFISKTPAGSLIVNNIVILPDGHLAYCCACVGDYGDFLENPDIALSKINSDLISVMLRKSTTASLLLKTAAEVDNTIAVFNDGENGPVTGSTCYQMLSGMRIN